MSIDGLPTREWNRQTSNNGDFWEDEFTKVYTLLAGGVGAIIHNPFLNQNPSADFPLFPMRFTDGVIKSAYDSSDPYRSGWPDLVKVMRAYRVEFPASIEGATAAGVEVTRVRVIAPGDIDVDLSAAAGVQRSYAEAIRKQVKEALTITPTYSAVFAFPPGTMLGNFDLSSTEWVALAGGLNSQSTWRLTTRSNEPTSGVVTFPSNNRPLLSWYPRRIPGQPNQAIHFSMRGRALHEQDYSMGFLSGGVWRDHFQAWKPVDGSIAATGAGQGDRFGGVPGSSALQIQVPGILERSNSGGAPRFREFTHSPAYVAHAYMIGGRKLDS